MLTANQTVVIPACYLQGRDPSDFIVLTVSDNNMYPLYHTGDVLLIRKATLPCDGAAIALVSERLLIGTIEDGRFLPLDYSQPPTDDFVLVGVPVILLREYQ